MSSPSANNVTSFTRGALGLAHRNLAKVLTNPALFLPSLLMPVFFFVAFAGGLSAVGDLPQFDYDGSYTAFQFVFVILQSAAFAGVFTGFSIAADFQFGLGSRFLLATPNRTALIAGYVLTALVRAALVFIILTAIALAAGMEVGGGGIDVFGLFVLGFAINFVAALFAAGMALRLRSMQAFPAIQMPVFLLLMLAPVYVPRELISGWVHTASGINPFTPVLDAGRALLAGDAADIALAGGVLAGMAALLLVFALRGLRSAEAAG
jgi:ABC-2 type transport system permease protein